MKNARGRDAGVLKTLTEAKAQLPFDLFSAILEKQEEGHCEDDEDYSYHGGSKYDHYFNRGLEDDDDDDDEYGGYSETRNRDFHAIHDINTTEFRIKKLVTLGGQQLAESMDLDEDDILQDNCFVDVDGKEISYEEGYSGNEVCYARLETLEFNRPV